MTTVSADERIPAWTIGDRLKKAREKTGLGQTDFAAELGISRGTVSNYEQYAGDPADLKRPYLAAWAMACDVPLGWLMYGEHASPRPGGGITLEGDHRPGLTGSGLSRRYGRDTRRYHDHMPVRRAA